jgi:hypothetical protein
LWPRRISSTSAPRCWSSNCGDWWPIVSAWSSDDCWLAALYAHTRVDEAQLAARIRRALESSPQISLAQLLLRFPLEHGLAELVTYLNLATRADGSIKALIDEARSECIDSDEHRYVLPEILFCR